MEKDTQKSPEYLINHGLMCPYCRCATELKDSSEVYTRSYGKIRICPTCKAYVNCYTATDRAMGSVAGPQLRMLRHVAHIWFDAIWKNKIKRSRYNAYSWLSLRLSLNKDVTHMGLFDEEKCRETIELCKRYIKNRKSEIYSSLEAEEKSFIARRASQDYEL